MILFDIKDFDIKGSGGEVVGNWIAFLIAIVPIGLLIWRRIVNVKRRKAGLPVSWMEKRNAKKSFDRTFSMIEDTLGSSESIYLPKKETKEQIDENVSRLEKELAQAKAKQEKNKIE